MTIPWPRLAQPHQWNAGVGIYPRARASTAKLDCEPQHISRPCDCPLGVSEAHRVTRMRLGRLRAVSKQTSDPQHMHLACHCQLVVSEVRQETGDRPGWQQAVSKQVASSGGEMREKHEESEGQPFCGSPDRVEPIECMRWRSVTCVCHRPCQGKGSQVTSCSHVKFMSVKIM